MANPLKRIDSEQLFFQEAVLFTAEKTAFNPMLVEKDYFCSLVLAYLYSSLPDLLIFKDGTALNKVHVGFYRLSEDLDFSIAMPIDSARSERSKAMVPVKKVFAQLPTGLPGLRISSPITGRNNSLQYIGEIEYPSVLEFQTGIIQIEIGLREPNLLETRILEARTLLLSPADGKPLVDVIPVRVYDAKETLAEKLRALFCRREPAIRDLFDINHMVANSILRHDDEELLNLSHRKITVPGNDFFGMTPDRVQILRAQVNGDLKPVLNERAYLKFKFDDSLRLATEIEAQIRKAGLIE